MNQPTRRRYGTQRYVAVMAIALAGLAAGPSSALADEVTVDFGSVGYTDDAGELSTVSVAAEPGRVTISQSDDSLTATDPACVGSGTSTVTCESPDLSFYRLTLGDQADVATAVGALGGKLNGGAGNDELTGSNENSINSDTLSGDEGDDVLDARDVVREEGQTGDGLIGGAGDDRIRGGNGDDSLVGDGFGPDPAAGRDVIDAGSGDDFVQPWNGGDGDQVRLGSGDDHAVETGGDGSGDSYHGGPGFDEIAFDNATTGPPGAVFDAFMVNLAAGIAVKANNDPEHNRLAGFEDVFTGVGDDVLIGSAGPNILDGGYGRDVIKPLDGADQVLARAGDDSVDVRDGTEDRVQCGAGVDRVRADWYDRLSGCERVWMAR